MKATYKQIQKRHIGRTCEILGHNRSEGIQQHGQIEAVANGVASIRVYVVEFADGQREYSKEGFLFTTPTTARSSRVVEIW